MLVLLGFCGWFYVASGYDYGNLAGIYTYRGKDVEALLVLNADRSFHESMTAAGETKQVDGEWRRVGGGTVIFPKQFLRLPGQKSDIEEFPDVIESDRVVQYAGHFEKVLGIFPILHLNANPPGPTFKRKLF